jgi:exodeoxyribonuclease VII small subunit
MVKESKTYSQLRRELDELLAWFEQDGLDVDEAIKKYDQAIVLTKELEQYLKTAENKIKKLDG